MKNLILKFCCFFLIGMSFSPVLAQENYFVVKDSITKEQLPYTTIDFLNGYGVFSNENGKVVLNEEFPEKIKVSFVGYEAKEILLANVSRSDVLLKPSTQMLKELNVIVEKEDIKKRKEFVTKPVLHENINRMYWSSLGQQYAFYIPNERKRGVLQSVSIPLIVKDLYQGMTEASFENKPYGTMMKIEFMENVADEPGEKLYDYDKTFVVHSGKISKKIDIDFQQKVPIPEEGLFVVLTVLGKTDEAGVYVPELPYNIREVQGVKRKFIKIILPNYPLVEAPKGALTLFRHVFDDNKKWHRINRPMVYKRGEEYPNYNIGIGYAITGY
ncbi:hypothetical protein [Flavobacterium sp.]|uniref:hypothetical protein n=1 Tax=Flavobacterium sp. TaxID=239 RepID=UPI0028BE9FA6|nr:hypothetical protein [Flavobacterium sp.]